MFLATRERCFGYSRFTLHLVEDNPRAPIRMITRQSFDSLVCVFSLTCPESLENIRILHLPLIRSQADIRNQRTRPCVLVGVDKRVPDDHIIQEAFQELSSTFITRWRFRSVVRRYWWILHLSVPTDCTAIFEGICEVTKRHIHLHKTECALFWWLITNKWSLSCVLLCRQLVGEAENWIETFPTELRLRWKWPSFMIQTKRYKDECCTPVIRDGYRSVEETFFCSFPSEMRNNSSSSYLVPALIRSSCFFARRLYGQHLRASLFLGWL